VRVYHGWNICGIRPSEKSQFHTI